MSCGFCLSNDLNYLKNQHIFIFWVDKRYFIFHYLYKFCENYLNIAKFVFYFLHGEHHEKRKKDAAHTQQRQEYQGSQTDVEIGAGQSG